ncbi:MAG: CDP-alcohol phosphatidyltransferase family protein [Candidatus Electryoneaceae bacterium]|nr:CDP-alcohol phosphatidyltransferase family protein [Candidatus Electryoneaceae bacterium]
MNQKEIDIPRPFQKGSRSDRAGESVWTEWRLVPNIISMGRIVLIVPIAVLYPLASEPSGALYWTVIVLLVVSYLSDYADGFIARRFDQKSRLGLILDPLADKLWTLVMICLLCLYRELPIWVGLSIVFRDISILIINVLIFKRTKRVMPSDDAGRTYMVFLGIMVIALTLHISEVLWLAYGLVVFALVTLGRY